MSILLMESWQGLASADVPDKYTCGASQGNIKIITSPTGPFQDKCLELSWSNTSRVYFSVTSSAEIVLGMWIQWNSNATGNQYQIGLAHTSDTNWGNYPQFQITLQSSIIKVLNRTNITTYSTIITGPKLSYDVWYFLEFKCTKAASGTAELRINGQYIDAYSGDTDYAGSDAIDAIWFQTTGQNQYVYYGPVYVLETSGDAPNDFLGPVKIEAFFPAADGTNTDFTISGESAEATHYESVDDPAPDEDTTYVVSSTPTDKDTFAYEDILQQGTTIYGMQLTLVASKDDADPRTLKQIFRSAGGVEFETSGEHFLGVGYGWFSNLWDTNPSGEIPWTEADINSGEIGFKLQA